VITLIVVDDHPVVRDGLAALIGTVDNLRLVASSDGGRAAVRAVRAHRPDVVLMDLQMSDGHGIDATREIVATVPGTAVIALTMAGDEHSITRAIAAGARGYVLKGATQQQILEAIETVAGGGAWYGPEAAAQILRRFGETSGVEAHGASLPALTQRETEVLDLLATGRRNHQIAQQLGLSTKTVANHLSIIFAKLGVDDRTQATIRARQAGLGQGPMRP
jgi:DNA-binding NarL/FixJ family response regulator